MRTSGISGAAATITVNTLSTAPGSASASPSSILAGNSSTLTVSGSSLGSADSWHWYSGSCGGVSAGTGASITVNPASTTTYYVRADGSTCAPTACVSVTVTVTGGTYGVINNGAYINIQAGSNFYIGNNTAYANYYNYQNGTNGTIINSGTIELLGNWYNNAANNVFSTDAGTTIFNGSSGQSINGTNPTYFYNLTLQTAETTTLNVNTQVGGSATKNGVFTLNNNTGAGSVLSLNSFTLTVTNPATTAIVRNGGYVLSETNAGVNPSILQWNIGGTTGDHVFPFGTNDPNYIPVHFNNSGAVGNISISTRRTAATNNTPLAGLSNVNLAVPYLHNTSGADISVSSVIDRWWDITSSLNPSPGTTPIPAVTLTLYYCGSENTTGQTSEIAIQHFANGGSGSYYFNNGQGGATGSYIDGNRTAVTVGTDYATAAGFTQFSPYVLVLKSNPLPVELLNFSASCMDDKIKLLWSTASETNNDYFSIDRSQDNNTWEFVTRVNGAGNSNSIINYVAYDNFPYVKTLLGELPTYYRMNQVDFNGNSKMYGPVAATCMESAGTGF